MKIIAIMCLLVASTAVSAKSLKDSELDLSNMPRGTSFTFTEEIPFPANETSIELADSVAGYCHLNLKSSYAYAKFIPVGYKMAVLNAEYISSLESNVKRTQTKITFSTGSPFKTLVCVSRVSAYQEISIQDFRDMTKEFMNTELSNPQTF